jgi:hypothetical protein
VYGKWEVSNEKRDEYILIFNAQDGRVNLIKHGVGFLTDSVESLSFEAKDANGMAIRHFEECILAMWTLAVNPQLSANLHTSSNTPK